MEWWKIVLITIGIIVSATIFAVKFFDYILAPCWREKITEEEIKPLKFHCSNCSTICDKLGNGKCPECGGTLKKMPERQLIY